MTPRLARLRRWCASVRLCGREGIKFGDEFHTYVLGGRSMGFATLMTGFGAFAGADLDAAVAASGTAPDYVV